MNFPPKTLTPLKHGTDTDERAGLTGTQLPWVPWGPEGKDSRARAWMQISKLTSVPACILFFIPSCIPSCLSSCIQGRRSGTRASWWLAGPTAQAPTVFADGAALVRLVHGVHALGLRTRGHRAQHLPAGLAAAPLTRRHLQHRPRSGAASPSSAETSHTSPAREDRDSGWGGSPGREYTDPTGQGPEVALSLPAPHRGASVFLLTHTVSFFTSFLLKKDFCFSKNYTARCAGFLPTQASCRCCIALPRASRPSGPTLSISAQQR